MLEKVRDEIENEIDKVRKEYKWQDSDVEYGLIVALRIVNKYILQEKNKNNA